ncbi:MAG: SAM-dependent methyltransferase [Muribaculaceae bacterium]
MDITRINDEFFSFVAEHEDDDVNRLRLKRWRDVEIDVEFAITQIECRKRIRRKLPEIYAEHSFLFPSVLSTEQATCEEIAKYHAEIVGDVGRLLDMTAGLCIDDYYMSVRASQVVAIEMNEVTAAVSGYNMGRFRDNIEVIHGDSIDYIERQPAGSFDAVFIDPARRGSNQSRVYGLADCEPNVLTLVQPISVVAPVLYVKASPMLDVTQVLREVPGVSDVWVVSQRNECKELFFKVDLKRGNCEKMVDGGDDCRSGDVEIHCVNFGVGGSREELSLPYSALHGRQCAMAAQVGLYVYEPNASIMKVGAFAELGELYGVEKIAAHSHLFTADMLRDDFPGRVFVVECVIPFKEKVVKAALKGEKRMNVSVRNFKLTAEQLKNRLKLSDGGDKYLIGTTLADGSLVVIVCHKA